MPEVALLNCPGCGAPLEAGSSGCVYCGARIRISSDGTKVIIAGMTCHDCGWDNAPDRLFCGKCGANLMEKCHKCGKANPIALQYCGACGSDVREARRQTLDRMVHEAKSKGWIDSPRGVSRHMELLRTVASPDETVVILRTGSNRNIDLHDDLTGQRCKTAFVATDRSFVFLESAGRGLLGSRPAVVKRVPFDEVKSLTVDQRKNDLVINFEGGQARLNLDGLAPPSPYGRARGIIHYFKPFLPLRLQQDW